MYRRPKRLIETRSYEPAVIESRRLINRCRLTWTKNALYVEVTHFDLVIRPATLDNSRIVGKQEVIGVSCG
jgi:hypothetical protein